MKYNKWTVMSSFQVKFSRIFKPHNFTVDHKLNLIKYLKVNFSSGLDYKLIISNVLTCDSE